MTKYKVTISNSNGDTTVKTIDINYKHDDVIERIEESFKAKNPDCNVFVEEVDEINKPFYASEHYFDLEDAAIDLRYSYGAKEKVTSAAKLAGKALCNAGLFTGKTGLFIAKEAVTNAPSIIAFMLESSLKEHSKNMSEEKIEKTTEAIKNLKGKKLI